MLFVQVPSARPHHQRRQLGAQLILLSFRTLVPDRSTNRVPQILLSFNIVAPGRRIRVLEIRHENIGARVQRVDDHLAIDRSGNFHAAIQQVLRNRRHLPLALANFGRLRQKIRELAVIDFLLHGSPPRQQFLPPRFESSRQFRQECLRFRGKNFGFNLASGRDWFRA